MSPPLSLLLRHSLVSASFARRFSLISCSVMLSSSRAMGLPMDLVCALTDQSSLSLDRATMLYSPQLRHPFFPLPSRWQCRTVPASNEGALSSRFGGKGRLRCFVLHTFVVEQVEDQQSCSSGTQEDDSCPARYRDQWTRCRFHLHRQRCRAWTRKCHSNCRCRPRTAVEMADDTDVSRLHSDMLPVVFSLTSFYAHDLVSMT